MSYVIGQWSPAYERLTPEQRADALLEPGQTHHFSLLSLPGRGRLDTEFVGAMGVCLGVFAARRSVLCCNVSDELLVLPTAEEAQRFLDEDPGVSERHERAALPLASVSFRAFKLSHYDGSRVELCRGETYERALDLFKIAMYDNLREGGSGYADAGIWCDGPPPPSQRTEAA